MVEWKIIIFKNAADVINDCSIERSRDISDLALKFLILHYRLRTNIERARTIEKQSDVS
jgi:hypothetical protein